MNLVHANIDAAWELESLYYSNVIMNSFIRSCQSMCINKLTLRELNPGSTGQPVDDRSTVGQPTWTTDVITLKIEPLSNHGQSAYHCTTRQIIWSRAIEHTLRLGKGFVWCRRLLHGICNFAQRIRNGIKPGSGRFPTAQLPSCGR